MGRAERRRAQKCEQKAKTATYNLTRAQLDALVREKISGELDRVKQEATNDAINQAMILLLTLPLEVLMDHYWRSHMQSGFQSLQSMFSNIMKSGKTMSWIWTSSKRIYGCTAVCD